MPSVVTTNDTNAKATNHLFIPPQTGDWDPNATSTEHSSKVGNLRLTQQPFRDYPATASGSARPTTPPPDMGARFDVGALNPALPGYRRRLAATNRVVRHLSWRRPPRLIPTGQHLQGQPDHGIHLYPPTSQAKPRHRLCRRETQPSHAGC